MSEFVKGAMAAGFTQAQAEFLEQNIAPHTHEIEDVEGLEEALYEEVEEDDE